VFNDESLPTAEHRARADFSTRLNIIWIDIEKALMLNAFHYEINEAEIVCHMPSIAFSVFLI
jgi:hypothetical protein